MLGRRYSRVPEGSAGCAMRPRPPCRPPRQMGFRRTRRAQTLGTRELQFRPHQHHCAALWCLAGLPSRLCQRQSVGGGWRAWKQVVALPASIGQGRETLALILGTPQNPCGLLHRVAAGELRRAWAACIQAAFILQFVSLYPSVARLEERLDRGQERCRLLGRAPSGLQ